jgi:hypothetical protein
MNFKEIFEKILPQKSEETEFFELEEKPEEKQISVRIENLNSFADSEKIQQFLREGQRNIFENKGFERKRYF